MGIIGRAALLCGLSLAPVAAAVADPIVAPQPYTLSMAEPLHMVQLNGTTAPAYLLAGDVLDLSFQPPGALNIRKSGRVDLRLVPLSSDASGAATTHLLTCRFANTASIKVSRYQKLANNPYYKQVDLKAAKVGADGVAKIPVDLYPQGISTMIELESADAQANGSWGFGGCTLSPPPKLTIPTFPKFPQGSQPKLP